MMLQIRRLRVQQADEQTYANWGKIPTADPLQQPGADLTFGWPPRSELFLWLCHPDHDRPADDEEGVHLDGPAGKICRLAHMAKPV